MTYYEVLDNTPFEIWPLVSLLADDLRSDGEENAPEITSDIKNVRDLLGR